MKAEERGANATQVESEIGVVSPGLYGCCETCQTNYGMEPREFYHAVHEAQTIQEETSFSGSECELCGSRLGGDREAAHATKETSKGKLEHTHLEICTDCLMATANGEPYTDE